ncbi:MULTISPECIES: DM13 domain-containing protein [Actinoalloteichus]|uniref:Electron transfer protein with DM13 domain n=1 Tax=Actinoalloteichus fjordicus TaxID=1612552 RepID=A0AAC9PPU0_9PSEU|nr:MULTISPECIES: DM13 domain-containing protein [Actinoalloteichus]APU12201.1 electron transfer protein with DM13 domain [Actinoalloteichus fjordicus]APU18153.1 electron transfer protein with DM13 domain [Actinoalloteichus sp. GBA129-24]
MKHSDGPRRGLLRRLMPMIGVGLSVVVLAVGLWAFQPWRLWTSSTVDEARPTVGPTSTSSMPIESEEPMAGSSADPVEPEPETAGPATPTEPIVLATGEFVSQEHETSGTAEVLELPDGSRIVRLTGLASSDGPDLRVALTDQEAGGDWFKYRDNRYHELGVLKGTHGNQNYPLPGDLDIAGLRSVVIWCERFSVAFGSAAVDL